MALNMSTVYNSLGVYPLPEAARLVGMPFAALNRWLYGYDYLSKNQNETVKKHSAPLWRPQYEAAEWGEKVIGFRDLLELRVVREFIQHGLSLRFIRSCLENAKTIFGVDYPFTTYRFATDGRAIFQDVVRESAAEEMIDLQKRQLVFRDIIKPSLYEGIEYTKDHARRWFPNGKKRDIVIDPERQFGKPIISDAGVPTNTLYASFQAEGADKSAINTTSRIFEVSLKNVESAIKFEERLRKVA